MYLKYFILRLKRKEAMIKKINHLFIGLSLLIPPLNQLKAEKNLNDLISDICPQIEHNKNDHLLSIANAILKGKNTITIEQLKIMLPTILQHLNPNLDHKFLDQINFDDIALRAQRIKDGCSEGINKDVTHPVSNNTSVDLEGIINILCLTQKDLKKCCKKLRRKIDKCCQGFENCCDEIKEEIDDCCDRLSIEIAECCEQTNNSINECCQNLTEEIENVSEQVEDCCDEVLESITECCQDLSEQIMEINNKVDQIIKSMNNIPA